MRLERESFLGDPFAIAKHSLLGSVLVTHLEGGITSGKITEVEVYRGGEDKAAHTYQYRRTKRVESQYLIGGHAYVFLVYGIHSQFCVVVGEENVPNSILVRSIEPIAGIDLMKRRRGIEETSPKLSSGPGNVCKCLGITTALDGADLCSGGQIYLERGEGVSQITAAKRVGIDYAEEYRDKLWRFYDGESPFVTHRKKR